MSGKEATTFIAWVSKDLAEMAINKTGVANHAEDPKHKQVDPLVIDLHELADAPAALPADPATHARQP